MASPAQIIRHKFLNTFFSRHSIWFLCIFTALTITWFRTVYTPHSIYYFISDTLLNGLWVVSSALSLLGLYDVLQNRHSILRNYPIMGHFRFYLKIYALKFANTLLKRIKMPFLSRMQRSLVYQRAKMRMQINLLDQLLMSTKKIIALLFIPLVHVHQRILRVSVFKLVMPNAFNLIVHPL